MNSDIDEQPIPDFKPVLETAAQYFRSGVPAWIPASHALTDYMLNVLPPMVQRGWNFAVGEPYNHESRGRAVYLCFRFHEGRHECRYATLHDFRKEVAALS